MHDWHHYVRTHLPPLAVSAERELEIVDELAVQLEAVYERERARGTSEDEARSRAEAEVPDWPALARTLGQIERPCIQPPTPGFDTRRHLAGVLTDLRHAVRSMSLWRGMSPAIAMLALAIGASTTVFVAAQSWLMPAPSQLIGNDVAMVWGTNHTIGQPRDVVSGPTFSDWQHRNRTFGSMAAFKQTEMTVRAGGLTDVIGTLEVTPGFFDVLPIKPAVGRTFVDEEAGTPAVMISFALWHRQFGADPAIAGRTLAEFGQPHTVVGVLPANFRFFHAPDVIALLNPRDLERDQRTTYLYWVIGKLRTRSSFDDATLDLATIMSMLADEHASVRGWEATVEPLRAVMREPVQWALAILIVTAGLVFAIGLANSLSLVAAHRVRRMREFAIRAALGATHARLRRLSTLESVLMVGLSAVLGIGLAYWAVAAVRTLVPQTAAIAGSAATIELPALAIDWEARGFVLLETLVIIMALRLPARPPSGVVSISQGASVGSPGLSASRYWLIAGQTAVSTLLVGVAALLLVMVAGLLATSPGFNPDGVLTMIVGRVEDLDAQARSRYYAEILRRVKEAPGVVTAALNDYVPLTNEDDYEGVEIPGHPRDSAGQLPREEWRRISDGYFAMMGIPMTRGRQFAAADDERGPSVVIVNEAMARKYWGTGDPIGARIRITSRPYGWSEVIGVAADVREAGLDKPAKPMMFVPFHRLPRPVMALFVRAAGSPGHVRAPVEHAVRAVDPTRPVFEARTMPAILRESYAVQWSTLMVAGALALLAMGMTMGGTYAIVWLVTTGRTREIGVRIALGASSTDVLATVLNEPIRAACIGIATGLVAVWLSSRGIRAHIAGIPSVDWLTTAMVATLVAGVVLAACVGPGRYARRIDPVRALRSE